MGTMRDQEEREHGGSTRLVFEQLRGMIVNGRLSPGTWMVEADIAGRLQLSRTPVRGALHLLEREGYVQSNGAGLKARMVVSPLTREDAGELYTIIGRLEGVGAKLAASLATTARRALTRRLREVNRELSRLGRGRQPDAGRIFELDLGFHRAILEAAAGPRLLDLHGRIQPQAERYWRLYAGAITDELHLSVAEHNSIIAALSRGDGEAAERGIQLNWSNGFARLARVIDALGERGGW